MSPRWPWLVTTGLVGFAAALSAEVAATVLLYAEGGFLRAATVVFAVEAGAFGLGLISGAARERMGGATIERARGWWFLAMVSFLLTTAFTGAWTIEGGGPSRMGQATGLVVLAALPLFACGGILAVVGASARTDADREGVGPIRTAYALGFPSASYLGGAAWCGAGIGLVTGGVFLPRVPPFSILLVCLITLAGGALLHARALERRPFVETLGRASADGGERMRVERWSMAHEGAERLAIVREERLAVAWDPRHLRRHDWLELFAVVTSVRAEFDEIRRVLVSGAELGLAIALSEQSRGISPPPLELAVIEGETAFTGLMSSLVPPPRSHGATPRFRWRALGEPPARGDAGFHLVVAEAAAAGRSPDRPAIHELMAQVVPDGGLLLLGAEIAPNIGGADWGWWAYRPQLRRESGFVLLGEPPSRPVLLGIRNGPSPWIRALELDGFDRIELEPTTVVSEADRPRTETAEGP